MNSKIYKKGAIHAGTGWPLMLASLIFWLAGLPGLVNASSLPQIKLTTSQAGLYSVTDTALAPALGISASAVDSLIASGGFTMLNQGQPVSWLPGNGNTEILFHAQALQNNYTQFNVYWLVPGTNVAPAFVSGGNPTAVPLASEYYLAITNIGQVAATNCQYSLANNPDSNYWYGPLLSGVNSRHNTLGTSFSLPNLSTTNVLVQVNVGLCGATAANQAYSLSANGNAAGSGSWYGEIPTNYTFAVPSAWLSGGSFISTAVGTGSDWFLSWFQVQYPRLYEAANGALVCGANSNAVVTIAGFTSANLTVLDVTQPSTPKQVNNLNIQSVSGGWEVSFVPAGLTNVYSVCQAGSEQAPVDIEAANSTGLASPTNQAAFIIIAPTNFLAASQPLVNYRNGQGLKTMLVSMEAVYNEFNNGLREPVAISNFLAYAWQNWSVPPNYVLFMGNGTYDYRNLLGMGGNYVPPLMAPSIYGLVASDSQYGQVTGATGPQIAVGRLPVTSTSQVSQMITKIMNFEATPPTGKAVALADLSDPVAGDFQAQMNLVTNALSAQYTVETVLPLNNATNTTTMRNNLLADLNAGADLLVYYGHGASSELGSAGYLTTTDIPNLTNTFRPPLVSTIGCLCGFFAQPGYDCISEALVLPAQQGAIATLTASGFTLDSDATNLNQLLMAGLVSSQPGRLGDFIQRAMTNYNHNFHYTPSAMYNLLGDPTLQYVSTVLTGNVNWDVNGNGVKDSGDTSGVTPTIIQIYAGGTNLVAAVTNSASGSYGVTNLPPGSYTVVQRVPSGWVATTPTSVSLTLVANGTATANFLDTQTVTIGNFVWLDANGNGLQDIGEPALPGVTEVLYQSNVVSHACVAVATNLSNASGFYEFTNLAPGVYEVSFLALSGSYTRSPQLVGSNNSVNSAPSQTTGLTAFFSLAPGQSNLTMNAGYVPNSSPVTIVSLKASATPGGVAVTWRTYDELDMLAFDVARSTSGVPVQDVTPDYVMAIGQDLGATYTVTDAAATVPGIYTYTLYGIDDNLSVERVGTVTVQVQASPVTAPTLTISGLTISGGNGVLNWSGGQPPYVVEQSTSLGADASWQAVGAAVTGTQMVVPMTNQMGFFRVLSSQ